MTDDLIAIIACCILGMMAHGANRQTWMEWVLRVTYALFILGESVTLLADPNGYIENPFNYGVLIGTMSISTMLLFRPGREFMSYILTFFNQLMGGRFLVAACGKLIQPVVVKKKLYPVTSLAGLSNAPAMAPASAPAVNNVDAKSAQSKNSEDKSASELANSESLDSTDAAKTQSSESVSEESSSSEASTASKAEDEGASTEQTASTEAIPAEEIGSSATDSMSAPDTEVDSSNSVTNSSAAATKQQVEDEPSAPLMEKVSFAKSFFAERIFMADSIPHMNGLWIYVTCMAFLLTHLEIAGFQMPSIMIPMPVTMDQLFSYNFLGLVLLSVCGTGIFLTRKPMEVLRRLGLVKPTWTQVLIGFVGIFVTFAYDWLWSFYTHSQEGLGYADKLSHYNEGTFTGGAAPGPALIVASATGLCAGLGEETLIRGALQPVFGILPAAFMHGVLHGQFAHAPLLILQVFGWSTLMCIIRRYTNTTTTIITHVGFNFLSTFLIAFNP